MKITENNLHAMIRYILFEERRANKNCEISESDEVVFNELDELEEKKEKLPGRQQYYVGDKTKKTKSNKQMAQEINKCAKEPRPKSCYDEWTADKTYKKKNESLCLADALLGELFEDFITDEILLEGKGISEKTKKTLRKKAKEANMPLGALTSVYKKGLAAWLTGHRQGTPQHAWAMGRVNSFISGGKTRKIDKSEWAKVQKHRQKKI
jgi:hypothetical protein